MSEAIESERPAGAAQRAESPLLEALGDAAPGPVEITERAFVERFNLRGDPGDAAFLDACQRFLGQALPLQPNTFISTGKAQLVWLGPNEWLLGEFPSGADQSIAPLREALTGIHHALTPLGAGYTTLRLRGALASALMARGCSLDLHADVFPVGHCAQTHIAKAVVLILKLDEDPSFEIVVRRSYADYLWRWLHYVNSEILATA